MAVKARSARQSAQKIHQELRKFEQDVILLSAKRQELVREHPDEWIGVYDGRVIGTAKSLPQLLEKIDSQRLPRDRVVTDFLAKKQLTMIL